MKKTRILVVEDERIVAEDIRTTLDGLGYEVCGVVGSGEEALEAVDERGPDLILMDIVLKGDMNGIEAARKIRSTRSVPVVYLTAYSDDAMIERAKVTEPHGYMLKPFSDRELRSTIEMAMYKHGMEERLRRLNAVVRAIRNVNQLIVREKDPGKLLQGTSDCLVRTRGYYNAWIALLDGSGNVTAWADSGFDGAFGAPADRLRQGEIPPCARKALAAGNPVLIRDVRSECPDCPLAGAHGSKGALAYRLQHEGRAYGVMVVSAPLDSIDDADEPGLFREVGDDIAFALHALAVEAERKKAEEALRASREELRALAGVLQSIREEERTLLARKIHDDMGHALAAVKMDLSWVSKNLSSETDVRTLAELQERMKTVSGRLDSVIQATRRIAGELRPALLEDFGLLAALEWEAEQLERRTQIKCAFESSLAEVSLERERSISLFRACEELLTNVAKHSNASAAKVAVRQDAGELVLEISDNGRGIAQEEVYSSTSFGLVGVRERLRLLGGRLTVSGRPGKGTTAAVNVPLGENEKSDEQVGAPGDETSWRACDENPDRR